jgi:hypothetical protein
VIMTSEPSTAATDDARCPKCDAPRGDRAACPRCGLRREHAVAWQARAALPPTATLGAAWAGCEAAWDDLAVHERAALAALATDDIGWLAGRYRDVLRTRPDDAMATARLELLVRQAQAAMIATATKPTPEAPSRKFPLVVVIVAVAALVIMMVYAAYATRRRDDHAGTGRRRPAEPLPDTRRGPAPPAIEPGTPGR